MIEREITPILADLFERYPFVTVTGPRQSGKTTLCRATFPNLAYVNLEAPAYGNLPNPTPEVFFLSFVAGAIIDEVQRVPALLSYLQVLADEIRGNGLFVLTGSEQSGYPMRSTSHWQEGRRYSGFYRSRYRSGNRRVRALR